MRKDARFGETTGGTLGLVVAKGILMKNEHTRLIFVVNLRQKVMFEVISIIRDLSIILGMFMFSFSIFYIWFHKE